MNFPKNAFLNAIRNGKQQIGMWLTLAESFSTEIVAGAGFDWLVIDMEHAHTDLATALRQLQVLAAFETTALVRPQWNDPVLVKRLLDAGAQGLIFPMIQSVDEARAAVAACRYPPNGIRGLSGVVRANGFGRCTDYFDKVEQETAIILQAETKEALDLADQYAEIDGVDAIFFGPADIAANMGYLRDPMNDAVWNEIMDCARRLIAKGVPVGTITLDPAFAQRLLDEGFTFVGCGMDAHLLAQATTQLRARMVSD